jgi:hypothetical protein
LSPLYYLQKYKTTQRPRLCNRCGQNAYYWHPSWDWVCASHLLDLINIGGMAFSWEEYPEVWQRTERLLQREAPSSTTVKNTELAEEIDVVNQENMWDGLNE